MLKQMKLESHKNLYSTYWWRQWLKRQRDWERKFISNKPALLEDSWHLSSMTILSFVLKESYVVFFQEMISWYQTGGFLSWLLVWKMDACRIWAKYSNVHIDQHKLQANKNKDVNNQGSYADQSNLCSVFVLLSVSQKQPFGLLP